MSASFRLCTLNGTLNNTKAYDGSPFYENGHYSSSYVINNIFLLNQRKSPVVKNMETAKIVSFAAGPALNNRQLQYSSSVSTRDLVGWFDIASYNTEVQFGTDDTTHPEYFNRDVTIKSSAITQYIGKNNGVIYTADYALTKIQPAGRKKFRPSCYLQSVGFVDIIRSNPCCWHIRR